MTERYAYVVRWRTAMGRKAVHVAKGMTDAVRVAQRAADEERINIRIEVAKKEESGK